MFKFLTLSIFLAFIPLFAKTTLTERFLKESLKSSPPTIRQLELNLLSSRLEASTLKERFNTNLRGSVNYLKTDERAFAQFIPVNSPITSTDIELSKVTHSGLRLGLRGFSDQITNNFVNRGTTTGLSISAGIDLWKDLFKGQTRDRVKSVQKMVEVSKIQTEVSKKAFLNSLRKIYWSLVANNEATKISGRLLKTSKKQVDLAVKRLKSKVADSGEVARYRSQYSSRKASITSLRYERENLIRSLKELLPSMAAEDLVLGSYSIESAKKVVLRCTALIASHASSPKDYTQYDEIITLLKEQEGLEKNVNSSHSAPEVIVQSEFGIKGRDLGYSETFDDLRENRYKNYRLGLQVNIPIGDRKKTTEEILQRVTQNKLQAQRENQLAKINAFHSQTVRQISYLRQIVKDQKNNTKFLNQSLKSSQKKYNQARLTVQELVFEQDAFLQANLDEIQTNLATLNTVLDYLSVFTETPCAFNRI